MLPSQQAAYIVEVDEQNIHSILEQSVTTPVLLDFWADWCQPCKTLGPLLEKIVHEYAGRLILAKVNADAQPMLAQQLGVRSLPTLKLVVGGRLAGEQVGAQPEAQLRKWLEPHVGTAQPEPEPTDPFLDQIERARRLGAYDQALDALDQALQEFPDRSEYRAARAQVLLDANRLDEAATEIELLADGSEKNRVSSRLFLCRTLQHSPEKAKLEQAVERGEVAALCRLGILLVLDGEFDAGLEYLLNAMRQDRHVENGLPQKALLAALDQLQKDDKRVSTYRRKLFALLH
jgi:putative thioredoxin